MQAVATRYESKVLWGDGFEADGWNDFLSASSWDTCSSDEFIRVFPRLVPGAGGSVPDCILQRLEECVAVLAWRARSRQNAAIQIALSSIPAHRIAALGRVKEQDWYPTAGRRAKHLAGDPGLRGADDEVRALSIMDRLLFELRSGSRPCFDVSAAASLVFWSGVHPVYLWPKALLFHQLFTAIGWLGHCARGRDALLPYDIAEYFREVIRPDAGGTARICDDVLAEYVRTPAVAKDLAQSARRRLAGYRTIFRMQSRSCASSNARAAT